MLKYLVPENRKFTKFLRRQSKINETLNWTPYQLHLNIPERLATTLDVRAILNW